MRSEARTLDIIETARLKPAKFRDERVNMAHGAGGKATQSLIEGLFAPVNQHTHRPVVEAGVPA